MLDKIHRAYHYLLAKFKKQIVPPYLRTHPKREALLTAQAIFNTLYDNVNTAAISQQERKALQNDEDAFTCGEIQFLSFCAILDAAMPKSGEVFYDLGSGAGKAVITAALCFDFSMIKGIEMLSGLSLLARTQLEKAQKLVKEDTDLFNKLMRIQFIHDDFLKQDFSDGDLFFIAATCFNYSTWDKLVIKLTQLKAGSRVIVTSKRIEHAEFELKSESCELMSWGENSVFVYVKKG